jgi:hypothetical protein
LIRLLVKQGDADELRARADSGNTSAAVGLVELMVERGDEAELRTRADAGDWSATAGLAQLLVEREDIEALRRETLRTGWPMRKELILMVESRDRRAADRLRRFGLTDNGIIPWTAADSLNDPS